MSAGFSGAHFYVGHQYTYDGANRLTRINAGPPSYTYFGPLRIKKVAGTATTVYIYSGSKPIVEYVNGSLSFSMLPRREQQVRLLLQPYLLLTTLSKTPVDTLS